jgi:serine protease Do
VAKEILGPLRTQGHVTRGYLGIQLQDVEPDLQQLLKLPENRGAVVLDVLPGDAGETAGLRRYDVILAVSGQKVDDGDHLVRIISQKPPGSAVQLTVFRDGKLENVEARLAERAPGEDDEEADEEDWEEDLSSQGDALGLVAGEMTPEAHRELQVPSERRGVFVREVVGLGPGLDVLAHGDVILEIDRKPIDGMSDYRKAVSALKDGDQAWLLVYRARPEGTFLAKVEVERRPSPAPPKGKSKERQR